MVFNMSAPCDLRVLATSNYLFPEEYVLQAVNFGYKTLAVDQEITLAQLEKVNSSFKHPVVQIPQSFKQQLQQIKAAGGGSSTKILSRVTVEYSSKLRFPKHIKGALEKFDIVAGRPQDKKALEKLVEEDIDIISLDANLKSMYLLTKELVGQALQKNIAFELEYAPCVSDSSVMRNTIQLAQDLLILCKGKNLILSSGHSNALFTRGPYDVINLAVLFGLPTNLAKQTVFGCAQDVVHRAEGRKSLSVNMDLKRVETAKEDETNKAQPTKRPANFNQHEHNLKQKKIKH